MSTALSLVSSARLCSPLSDVDNQTWERFIAALSIHDSGPNKGRYRNFAERRGGYGCFGIQPRRLVDIGIASGVRIVDGKVISAVFKPTKSAPTPVIAERAFLISPTAQRDVLVVSLVLYAKIHEALPSGMTRSGALALYHRLGPCAIEKWAKHKEPSTAALFERTNGLF